MAYLGKVFRWELVLGGSGAARSTEQAGDRRPVIVVSNDDANAAFGTVTVVPLTKLEGKGRSVKFFEVELPPATIPNGYTSLALPHQIRTISKTRLLEHIGSLKASGARYRVECGILDHLGIDFDDSE